MQVFVHAPENFENLCVLARTLEVFGFADCYVYDPHRIVRDRYGKSYAQKLRTVSAGAFSKVRWQRIEADPLVFLRSHSGRRVATVPRQSATSLHHFRFRASDLLVIGSEGRGLDEAVLELCQAQVTIPQAGITESLNVAVASGIVLAEFKRQEALQLLEPRAADGRSAGRDECELFCDFAQQRFALGVGIVGQHCNADASIELNGDQYTAHQEVPEG